MARNEYRPNKTPKRKAIREMSSMLEASSWFQYDRFIERLPFLLFCVFLAGVYIYNRHTMERRIRDLDRVQKEIVELRWYHDSAKDELARKSRQSSVARLVESQGIEELMKPPHVIAAGEEAEAVSDYRRNLSN